MHILPDDYNINYTKAEEYFTQEELKLFLKIPHQTTKYEHFNVIDFNVPENGTYPLLSRVTFVETFRPLTIQDRETDDMYHLPNYAYHEKIPGIYVNTNHGSQVFDLLKELYKHDKKNAEPLLAQYYANALNSEDIRSISSKLVLHVNAMKEYLEKENIKVSDYGLDYSEFINKENEDSFFEEDANGEKIEKLNQIYSEPSQFDSYNDLDYTPLMVGNEYHIYDSSGARLFVVREEGDTQKIYLVDGDNTPTIMDKLDDRANDFIYTHHQKEVLLSKTIGPQDLIGEIKNGTIIKATVELTTFDLIQSFIVDELVEKEKIVFAVPDLSFQELLKNYTLQNQFYNLEERSIVPMLSSLKLVDDKITYNGFSLMDLNKDIKHENITDYRLQELKESLDEMNHLDSLPPKHVTQITSYLNELISKNNNEFAQEFSTLIFQKIGNNNVKHKTRKSP